MVLKPGALLLFWNDTCSSGMYQPWAKSILTHLECYCFVRFCCKQEVLPCLIRRFNPLFIRWHEAVSWRNAFCYLGIIHLQTSNENTLEAAYKEELKDYFRLNKLYSRDNICVKKDFWLTNLLWENLNSSTNSSLDLHVNVSNLLHNSYLKE